MDDKVLPHFQIVSDVGSQKPWITMIHGSSQHSGIFEPYWKSLREQYQLLVIDLPGHGKSQFHPGPYGLAEYAVSVLKVLNFLNIECTHFWGTHTGSGIGLMLAAKTPERFTSLLLEGAILPGVGMASVDMALAKAQKTAREFGVSAAYYEWFATAEWFKIIRDKQIKCRAAEYFSLTSEFGGGPWTDMQKNGAVEPIIEKLAQLRIPVLLVNGEFDGTDFLLVASELASHLPNARRAIIQGAGGFPLWEFPEIVIELANDLFQNYRQWSSNASLVT